MLYMDVWKEKTGMRRTTLFGGVSELTVMSTGQQHVPTRYRLAGAVVLTRFNKIATQCSNSLDGRRIGSY